MNVVLCSSLFPSHVKYTVPHSYRPVGRYPSVTHVPQFREFLELSLKIPSVISPQVSLCLNPVAVKALGSFAQQAGSRLLDWKSFASL